MSLARNSLYNLAGTLLPIVLGLATVPLYIRAIGMERYGALAIAWLLLGYFGQADFGIGRAVTQRIAAFRGADRQAVAEIIWSGVTSISLFGLAGALCIYWGGYWFFGSLFKVDTALRAELTQSLWMLALCNPIVALAGVTSGSLIGAERFKVVSISNLIGSSALQVLPLMAAHLLGSSMGVLIAASLLARLIGLGILSVAVWGRFLKGQRVCIAWGEMRRLASFGKWIMVTAIVGPLMTFADRFVIGAVLGAAAVAAYSIPFQIASRTIVLPGAVVQVLFPRFALEPEDQAQIRAASAAIAVGLVFAPIILVLMALTEPLLQLWLGTALDPRSVPIARIFLAGLWVNGIAQVPYALLQARGNPRFTALLHVFELPFYLAMLYAMGVHWQLAGCAIAFSLRCLVDMLALLRACRFRLRQMISQLWAPALAIMLVFLIAPLLTGWAPSLAAAAVLAAASIISCALYLPADMKKWCVGMMEPMLPARWRSARLSAGDGEDSDRHWI